MRMLENTSSLLPLLSSALNPDHVLKAICVGIDADSLDELDRLLTTLGIQVADRLIMNSQRVSPATYVGSGKIEETKKILEEKNADVVILDVDLTPNQLKNLEKEVGKPILDRSGVIIEIFSQHARTKESKTQVELARLQYLLPRLSHFWTHFERQRGGVGNKGMGEKQIEVDRRLVKKRMSVLRERLEAIGRERDVQRSGRKNVLKVALVGYTNAGKSTLLNALTHSHVLAEDKLFATLDSSVRTLNPHSHPPLVLIDTVGFINRLPPTLVASFRSTLEELEEADMLLHVVDASATQNSEKGLELVREQMDVTEQILKDLKVDTKPRMTVFNKADLLITAVARNRLKILAPKSTDGDGGTHKKIMMVSAMNPDEVTLLRDAILEHFYGKMELYEVLIPYLESRLEAMVHAHGSIEVKRHLEKGTFYRVRMEKGQADKLELGKFRI